MADTVRTCIGIDVGGTFTDCVLTDGAQHLAGRRRPRRRGRSARAYWPQPSSPPSEAAPPSMPC